MATPATITEPRQLVVEGRDASLFLEAFLRHEKVAGVQVQNFGGNSELGSFLGALANVSGFRANVESIGIVRDADQAATAALQSVKSAVRKVGWQAPTQVLRAVGRNPRVIALILPGRGRSGMLEDLLLSAVANDPGIPCVSDFVRCMRSSLKTMPKPMAKARVHAFLATRPKPDLLVGQAASAGYFEFDSSAYDDVRQLLNIL